MSMFTLTPQQFNQGMTNYNNYMSQIDAMRRRAGNRYLLENPSPLKKAPDIPAAGASGAMPTTRIIDTPDTPIQAPATPALGYARSAPGDNFPTSSGVQSKQTAGLTLQNYDPSKKVNMANIGRSGTPDITQVDPESSAFVQDVQGLLARSDFTAALEKIKVRAATGYGDKLAGSPGGQAYGYFFDTPAEAKARSKSVEASNWFQSDEALKYFQQNPDQITKAALDPTGWYNSLKTGTADTSKLVPVPVKPAPVPAPAPAPATAQITTNANVPKFSKADVDLLGRIVQAEAGNQSEKGKQAVAATIINRLNSGQYGNTLQSVLTASGQFQPVTAVGGNLSKLKRANVKTQRAVSQLLNNFSAKNPVGNALFFQNPAASTMIFPSLQPYFNQQGKSTGAIPASSGIIQIGDHVFSPRYNPVPGVPEEDFTFGSSAPAPVTTQPVTNTQTVTTQPVTNTQTVINNRGRKVTVPARQTAGLVTDGTKSPTQEAANQKNPKPKILSNWTPAMFNAEVNNGRSVYRSAKEAARVALLRQDADAFNRARVAVDNAATSLENIVVQKGINMFENGGDPRMLMALESRASSTDTIIRPRSDGNYDIEVNGEVKKEGMSRSEVVSMFRRAASQRFTEGVNAAQVARRVAQAETKAKLAIELAKIKSKGEMDAYVERNKTTVTKTEAGSYVITDATGLYNVTPRDASDNELKLNPKKLTYFDVELVKPVAITRGGEESAGPGGLGLTIFNKVSGSK